MVKTLSDVTIGTVIVLVHVALAEHANTRRLQTARDRAGPCPVIC